MVFFVVVKQTSLFALLKALLCQGNLKIQTRKNKSFDWSAVG